MFECLNGPTYLQTLDVVNGLVFSDIPSEGGGGGGRKLSLNTTV